MRSLFHRVITILVASEQLQEHVLLQHVREVERLNNSRAGSLVRSLVLVRPSTTPALIYKIRSYGAEALPFGPADAGIKIVH